MRLRPRSIRFRATAAATLIVAAAFALAGWTVMAVLHHQLVADVDRSLRARAVEVATVAAARGGEFPPTFPSADDDAPAVQVVDAGAVIARSGFVPLHRRLGRVVPAPGHTVIQTSAHPPVGDGSRYRVLAYRPRHANNVTIYAAASLEAVDHSVATVRLALVAAIPVLTLVVGVLTFLVVGRALGPVEEIRRQVAEITAAALDRRIPDPGSADEISRLAHTMNAMLDRLDTATKRQRAFVADASHEFRSPLASIQTQLEVALARRQKTDWAVVARRVIDENERLQRMVDDLLALASLDEQRTVRDRAVVDLDEVVLREIEPVRARGKVSVDITGIEGGRVLGDRKQLARLVRNVVENAERHAHDRLRVSLRQRNGTVELVVQDDGPGVLPADRERVFERFTRLDEARSRGEGGAAGLGLAIARAVANAHGGTVVIGDSDAGARVVATIPTDGA